METLDDDIIAQLLRTDPERALTELLRKHGGMVAGALTKRYGPALDLHDLEEVIHEASVRAWRYGASYDPSQGNLCGWFLTIAYHKANDEIRIRLRRRQRETSLTFDPGFDPELEHNVDDHFELLDNAVQGLPKRQREAVMGLLDGLTFAELEQKLGVTNNALHQLLHRARSNLRDLMTQALKSIAEV